MNDAALNKLVGKALDPMADRLGIAHLRISVRPKDLDRDEDSRVTGQSLSKPLYERINVYLDNAHLAGEAEALETLRHELLHWYNRELELHHDLCMAVVPDAAKPAIEEHFAQMCEEQVRNLERMLDAHGATPKMLASRGRRKH